MLLSSASSAKASTGRDKKTVKNLAHQDHSKGRQRFFGKGNKKDPCIFFNRGDMRTWSDIEHALQNKKKEVDSREELTSLRHRRGDPRRLSLLGRACRTTKGSRCKKKKKQDTCPQADPQVGG